MTGGLDRDLLESRGEHETCLSERNDRLLETESAEFCLNRVLPGFLLGQVASRLPCIQPGRP